MWCTMEPQKKQQEMRLTDFQIVNALNFIHCRLVS